MIRRLVVWGAVAAMTVGGARGEEYTFPVHDVTVVQDGHGMARVLFRTGTLPASDRVLVERAVLTVPYAGAVGEGGIELRVCPVTASWSGWSTPFDEELYARSEMDFARESGALSFDLTVAFQAMREHGLSADGFVVTVTEPEEGVPLQHLSRIAGLSGASVKVTTLTLPSGPPPPGWVERQRG
jgi:hypothetical protein